MHPNTFPVPAYPVNQHPQQAFHQPYYSPPQYPVQQPQRVPSRSVELLQMPVGSGTDGISCPAPHSRELWGVPSRVVCKQG